MRLAEEIYELSQKLPESEKFGLVNQMRRAAVSVPANIAEGYGRSHRGDYIRHLSIARGSLMEVETHITLAVRLNMLPRSEAIKPWRTAQETGKTLTSLIKSLRKLQDPTPPQKTTIPRP
jgi:four helix bundle protein